MSDVLEFTKEALWLVLLLSGPPVAAAALIGLVVAFLQAATQLQEQTFPYALKFLAVVITLFVTASLMGGTLYVFADRIFIDFPRPRPTLMDFGTNPMLALALTLPRVAGAFMMLPLLTTETVPAMVRNSFMVSLAIVAIPIALAGAPPIEAAGTAHWTAIVLKETFIGISIGFCYGIVFWAISSAGVIIDTQVGMSMAQIFDPIQGHQTSLHGEFLSQFSTWLFMASGAFLVFLDLLMTSYTVWPVMSFFPDLRMSGMALFVGQFGYLMTAMLLIAAPAMVILLVIDLSFGLVNRYAPQLNVFALTMPIKAWLATAIFLLMIGVFVEIVMTRLVDNSGLIEALKHAFSAT